MEQLYLIEIFVNKIVTYLDEDDTKVNTDKELIIRSSFGGKSQFIIKENQLYRAKRHDIIELDKEPDKYKNNYRGAKKWTRIYRVGKSFLYHATPDQIQDTFEKFPFEFQVWSGEENEKPAELIGVGKLYWHTAFVPHIQENMEICYPHNALSTKEVVPIMAECCCVQVADLYVVIRFTPLGGCIITDFQQLIDHDPETFVFKNDKTLSKYECKRIEVDNAAYNTKDGIYEIAAREDPGVLAKMKRKIEICTELESCGMNRPGSAFACQAPIGAPKPDDVLDSKVYPIDKIRMGDITGPCGNINCPIAHKMKTFIRNQYAYKRETYKNPIPSKPPNKKSRVCGQCACNNDLYHVERVDDVDSKPLCVLCGGVAQTGETCDARLNKLHGTGVTPISSKTDMILNKAAVARGEKK